MKKVVITIGYYEFDELVYTDTFYGYIDSISNDLFDENLKKLKYDEEFYLVTYKYCKQENENEN